MPPCCNWIVRSVSEAECCGFESHRGHKCVGAVIGNQLELKPPDSCGFDAHPAYMETKVKSKIEIEFEIDVIEEDNGMFSCHIPEYDMWFSAKKAEDIERKGKAMIGSMFHFLHSENKDTVVVKYLGK